MKRFTKVVALVASILLASLVSFVSTPAESAYATGYTVSLSANNLQPGEPVEIRPNDACPSLVNGIPWAVIVFFEDSSSWEDNDAPQNVENLDGSWDSAIYPIPKTASLGQATLKVVCYDMYGEGDSALPVMEYETVDINIVSQSTSLSVSSTNWGSGAIFTPLFSCNPYSTVIVDMYSEEFFGWQTSDVRWATHVSDVITADASGNWTYTINLSPGVGNANYPGESLQQPGDTYYFNAQCASGGTGPYGSLKFIANDPHYVAMGDSYSSGEGSFNYDIDSSVCHRSSDAYAYYVSQQKGLGRPLMAACSGAQTYDIAHAGVSGAPQRNSLSLDTEIVTITIGGNDVGFAEVLEKCAHTPFNTGFGCATDSYLPNAVNDRLSALEGTAVSPVYTNGKLVSSITQVLLEIEEYAPNADIYIAGYPKLFGDDISYYSVASGAPGGAVCGVLPSLVTVSYDDAQWMNAVAEELNDIIEAEVTYAKGLGVSVEYVAPLFGGHALCDSGSSWLNGVILNDATPPKPISESVHPTTEGMWLGYGIAFSSVIP